MDDFKVGDKVILSYRFPGKTHNAVVNGPVAAINDSVISVQVGRLVTVVPWEYVIGLRLA